MICADFAGMGEAIAPEPGNDGLADGLDKEILSGTDGLFAGTNLANNNVTANDTFDTYLKGNLVWDQIDGRYASMASDLAYGDGRGNLRRHVLVRLTAIPLITLTARLLTGLWNWLAVSG